MNKLLLTTASLIFVLLSSACDNQLGIESNTLAVSRDYFPMHTGDTWLYRFIGESSSYELQVEVTDTEIIDGNEYYVFRYTTNNDYSTYTAYFRKDGAAKVFRYENGRERLYIDFDSAENDTTTYRGYVSLHENNKSTEGFDNCITITYDSQDTYAQPITEIYAPGVGLVQRKTSAGTLYYISATIDGRKIEEF
jgi:hypothetical protein